MQYKHFNEGGPMGRMFREGPNISGGSYYYKKNGPPSPNIVKYFDRGVLSRGVPLFCDSTEDRIASLRDLRMPHTSSWPKACMGSIKIQDPMTDSGP
jgi:hypothetical protein